MPEQPQPSTSPSAPTPASDSAHRAGGTGTTDPVRDEATTRAPVPRWAPGLTAAVLLLAALVAGGTTGWVLTAVATLMVAWLLVATWPYLSLPGRLLQLAVWLVAYVAVIVRLVPRG